jgi:hypothetical protein
MRSLSGDHLLRLWETGCRRHPLDRALLLLHAAMPDTSYELLADWPLGRRNQTLVELHCRWFGPDLQARIACARCGEQLEFALDGRIITSAGTPPPETADGRGVDATIAFNHQTFRLPTSRDLTIAAVEADPRHAAIRIAERCRIALQSDALTDACTAGLGKLAPESWSDSDIEAIGERMAAADPLAETRLTLHCPACGNDWEETLDIVSFLWTEIDARARRLLLQIHTLASAYGWAEADILSLGEDRRVRYVEMVQS